MGRLGGVNLDDDWGNAPISYEEDSLLERCRRSAAERTPEKRAQLLVDAKILTEEGHYNPFYFRDETVAKSKRR